jgi:TIR domain
MYYTERELRVLTSAMTASAARDSLRLQARNPQGVFDIFLSHSLTDALLVMAVRRLLESQGLRVYVDWIDDPLLDRNSVTSSTARQLRERMGQSRSLIYATSKAASKSRWMPWELGYFDGFKDPDHVCILPIENGSSLSFDGQEYLGLYKVIERLPLVSTAPRVVATTRAKTEPLSSFVSGASQFVAYRADAR